MSERPRVVLEIDELVLHGFSAADRHRVADALQAELTRLLTVRGLPPSLSRPGARAEVDAGAFEVSDGGKAESTGAQAARSVYAGLGR